MYSLMGLQASVEDIIKVMMAIFNLYLLGVGLMNVHLGLVNHHLT